MTFFLLTYTQSFLFTFMFECYDYELKDLKFIRSQMGFVSTNEIF
jgi:hypothetical protein